MKILVVEDEERIASFLDKGLSANGYVVERRVNGTDALAVVPDFDLAILDLGLPDIDGLDVLRRWRDRGVTAPVVILTARDGVDDRVDGLNLGAVDYLPKPFAFNELLARVRARLKPSGGGSATVLRTGRLSLDLLTRRVSADDRVVELTARNSRCSRSSCATRATSSRENISCLGSGVSISILARTSLMSTWGTCGAGSGETCSRRYVARVIASGGSRCFAPSGRGERARR